MNDFVLHTNESAPEDSREIMQAAEARYGFAPNLMRVMAESPAAVHGYWALGGIFAERSSLTPAEQQVVLLAVSHTNECDYCMAAHTGAAVGAGLPENEIDALRAGGPLTDPRLEALRRFTAEVVSRVGYPSDEALGAFLEAGFDRRAVLDVLVGVALKTLSNYTNHIAGTPLDGAFERWAWTASAEAAGAATR